MKCIFPIALASFSLVLITACNQRQPVVRVTSTSEPAVPAAETAGVIASGTVTETMNTSGYTYVQVDTGNESVWAAAPECVVKVGDQVVVADGMPMHDFHSDTLDRDFEVIYFVSSLSNAAGEPMPTSTGMPPGPAMMPGHGLMPGHGSMPSHGSMSGHGSTSSMSEPAEIDLSGIEKAEGGHTVADVYAQKAELSDKKVSVRGRVVKINRQIMGRNWLHVRDGTGDADAGTNDLTVTSGVDANVGDTVLVTGEVHVDQDFGYGYQYDVIVEDAQVVVE